MMDKMMGMMMDRMMEKMSKEDIHAMMAEMMGQMFAGMDLADKIAFMQTMMGVCIPRITEGLDPAEREKLAESLLDRMAEEMKSSAQTARDEQS